jgi:hypothetical protein
MKAVCTSETSVYFNETTRRYIPENCHLHTLPAFVWRNWDKPRIRLRTAIFRTRFELSISNTNPHLTANPNCCATRSVSNKRQSFCSMDTLYSGRSNCWPVTKLTELAGETSLSLAVGRARWASRTTTHYTTIVQVTRS